MENKILLYRRTCNFKSDRGVGNIGAFPPLPTQIHMLVPFVGENNRIYNFLVQHVVLPCFLFPLNQSVLLKNILNFIEIF